MELLPEQELIERIKGYHGGYSFEQTQALLANILARYEEATKKLASMNDLLTFIREKAKGCEFKSCVKFGFWTDTKGGNTWYFCDEHGPRIKGAKKSVLGEILSKIDSLQ